MIPGQVTKPFSRPNGPLPFFDAFTKDGEDFERFCTDLLNHRPAFCVEVGGIAQERRVISAERLDGGDDQGGADILVTIEGGQRWVVQCKREKGFGPTQAERARNKLEKGFPDADRYILAVTKTLTLKARRTLGPKWEVWDPDRLTVLATRIRPKADAIQLVQRYFDPAQARRLFPWTAGLWVKWQDYFQTELAEPGSAFHHRLPFVPMGDLLERMIEFAGAEEKRVAVLKGSVGQGKSRVLLELARRLGESPDPIHVQFLNHGAEAVTPDDLDLLSHDPDPRLLVVEDADRHLKSLAQIARAISANNNVRLMAAVRLSAEPAVRKVLLEAGHDADRVVRFEVPRWKKSWIQQLADSALSPDCRPQISRLAELSDRSPLLVVLGSAVVRAGSFPDAMLTHEVFEQRVLDGLLKDVLELQPEHQRDLFRRLCQVLAFIGPVQRNPALVERIAGLLEKSGLDMDHALDVLISSGLVVDGSDGLQLYPPLFSDALLRQASVNGSGQPSVLVRRLAASLSLDEFPSLVRNLSIADWEASAGSTTGAEGSLMNSVWSTLLARLHKGASDERRALLEAWIPTAGYQPQRSLELVRWVLSEPRAESRGDADEILHFDDAPAGSGLYSEAPYDIGVLTVAAQALLPVVVWHPDRAQGALDLLWELGGRIPSAGSEATGHPINLIAKAASLGVNKPWEASESVLAWLEARLGKDHQTDSRFLEPGVFSALLKPFLTRVVEQDCWDGAQFRPERFLLDPDRMSPLRQRAIALINLWLRSNDVVRIREALPCIRIELDPSLDLSGRPRESPHALAWQKQSLVALDEFASTLPLLAEHPFVLVEMGEFLWRLALCKAAPELANRCRELLKRIPDTFELRLIRAISWNRFDPGFAEESFADPVTREDARWQHRCQQMARVAGECLHRWPTAQPLCEGLADWVEHAPNAGVLIDLRDIGDALASRSSAFAIELLEALLAASSDSLDDLLVVVFSKVSEQSPDALDARLPTLIDACSPGRIEKWIGSLEFRPKESPQFRPAEIAALESIASRPGESIVWSLTEFSEGLSNRDPALARRILRRLRPTTQASADRMLGALGVVLESQPDGDAEELVASCLTTLTTARFAWLNLGHLILPILEAAPKAAYRNLAAQVEEGDGPDLYGLSWGGVRFGTMDDTGFLDQEIRRLWNQKSGTHTEFSARLRLLQALVDADRNGAERRRKLIRDALNRDELLKAVGVVFPEYGQRVLVWPELAGLALTQGDALQCRDEVSNRLFLSIMGGSRSWSEGEPVSEFASIVHRAQDLTNKYADHPALARLYSSIAEAEAKSNEKRRLEHRKRLDALN
jgi:hypothetical protein